ncbi:MAG TPA: MEDS domain-containing protein [Mycobacteriales bacterium]|nr:MEDS domain-containing protein [Mycobacteriales bacterium]
MSAVEALQSGSHASWGYSTDEEHAEVLHAFLAAGLSGDERVLYFGDAVEVRNVLVGLSVDVDTAMLLRTGKLVVGDAEEAYLRDGVFDPGTCVDGFREVAAQAVFDGYAGIRVAGENTSIIDLPGVRESWYDYEIRVELLTASAPILGLCCFDRRRCDDRVLALLGSVHRAVVDVAGSAPRLAFTLRGRPDGRLALAGEVDSFTAPQLKEVLTGPTQHLDDLVIDVSELDFIDSAGVRLLERLAQGRGAHRRPMTLVGATSHLQSIWPLVHPPDASALVVRRDPLPGVLAAVP